MDKAAAMLAGVVLVGLALFLAVLFGTLVGAATGWIVGLFFGDTILGIAGQLGIHGVGMWQLGAFLGFMGGFLKTKVTAEAASK